MVSAAAVDSLNPRCSFLQSSYWAELKRRFGWRPYAFTIENPGPFNASLLVLVRSPVPGITLAYVPHGPELSTAAPGASAPPGGAPESPNGAVSALAELGESLARQLPQHTSFIRFDLPWEFAVGAAGDDRQTEPAKLSRARSMLGRAGRLRRSEGEIQPRATVLINLDDDEALLAQMKSKWRYNIRLAARRGVTVETVGPELLDEWYRLYRETAARDRIAIHSESYYRAVFEVADEVPDAPEIELMLARHEGELLAGIIVARYRERATYLYGASADRKRNLMPTYALQWEAMRRARDAGMRVYDLFGIPRSADEKHRMQGLYRFKTGFGGCVVERPGCVDYRLRTVRYGAFRAVEALRAARLRRRKPRKRRQ